MAVRTINRSYLALTIVKRSPSKYSLGELAVMVGTTAAGLQHLVDTGAMIRSRAKVTKGKRIAAAITLKVGPIGEDKLFFYNGAASMPPNVKE